MPSKKTIDITPTVNVLHSLQRTGYHWSQAMLDIIDNSVDTLRERHEQTSQTDGMIRVIPHGYSDKSVSPSKARYIIVADNGMGMDAEQLQEILRLGESGKRGTQALGTFGMGLKTAAMSLGSNLSIVSTMTTVNELNAVTWDVESCMKKGKFEANFVSDPSAALINTYLDSVGDGAGTMVIIGNLHEGFPTIPSMTQTLNSKCAHVYRHMLNSDSPLGYHFPYKIIVGKTTASKEVVKTNDPLCIDHEFTSVLIGDSIGKFQTEKYGNCNLQIRMTRFDSHNSQNATRSESRKARTNSGLGKDIRGTHKQGVYWLRTGREICCGAFWSSHPLLSNVYAEISFEDSGMATDNSPIRMDFGQKGVEMDDDLREHLIKHIFEPHLEKIRKEYAANAKAKKASDRSEIMKRVSSVSLPTEHFGRTKATKRDAKTEALERLFSPPKKESNSKRKNSKYRGTGMTIGNNEIDIEFEECTWPESPLPFCINYTVGDPVVMIQLNVEDSWVESNIYLCEDSKLVARSLHQVAAMALTVMHDDNEKRIELITKYGIALKLFDDDFGRLESELEEMEIIPVINTDTDHASVEEMIN